MSESTKCPGSLFGAHRFEARYSESSEFPRGVELKGHWWAETIEQLRARVKKYEGDVCVRCGEMRKFSPEEKS